jgi:hypothetical protein
MVIYRGYGPICRQHENGSSEKENKILSSSPSEEIQEAIRNSTIGRSHTR